MTSAELAARRAAATAALADFNHATDESLAETIAEWAFRLASELASVLQRLDQEDAAPLTPAEDLALQLASIGDARDAYRAALEVVREGLAIPYAATVGDDEKRAAILHERLMHVLLMVGQILNPTSALGAEWELDYCREQLAKHPATGYRVFGEPAGGAS